MSSGKGQERPAVCVRFSVSRTVERAMPSRRAISCVETEETFSRIISRAWRIVIRSAGIDRSLGLPKGRPDQANGGARQSTKHPGRDHSVMGGDNHLGIGGRHHPVTGGRQSSRNWGAASSGISRPRTLAGFLSRAQPLDLDFPREPPFCLGPRRSQHHRCQNGLSPTTALPETTDCSWREIAERQLFSQLYRPRYR